MEQLYLVGFLGAAAAILFAWGQSRRVLSYSEGSEAMRKIAAAIRSGADAYLKHQYATVAKVFLVVFVLLLLMAFGTGGEMLSRFTPFAFLTGGVWSMLSGLVGMKIATSANARHRPGRQREPEPRPAGGLLLRVGDGLHGGGAGDAGHLPVVPLPAGIRRN